MKLAIAAFGRVRLRYWCRSSDKTVSNHDAWEMKALFSRAIAYFGAHLVPSRDQHERDRAIQRVVIAVVLGAISLWVTEGASAPRTSAAPFIAASYGAIALLHLHLLTSNPGKLVGAQYFFILADPLVTIAMLVSAPITLSPLCPLVMVQLVRTGIRFGPRTMWLAWVACVAASVSLMPFDSFWSIREPLTKAYVVMIGMTPILFGPLIARLHRATADLRAAAASDPLTGLGNRRMLSEHLRLAQERSQRDQTMLALIVFDLDNFKAVNDVLGHSCGDTLLSAVARAVKGVSRVGDFLARIGGDEFVLLVEGLSVIDGRDQARAIGEKIVGSVVAAATECCSSVPVSASVGVYCWQAKVELAAVEAELIERADLAMYSAKKAGKARVVMAPA